MKHKGKLVEAILIDSMHGRGYALLARSLSGEMGGPYGIASPGKARTEHRDV